jgi:hypothetical protein
LRSYEFHLGSKFVLLDLFAGGCFCFSGSGKGESFVVSAVIAGREQQAVSIVGPAADGRAAGLAVRGGEFAQVQSIAKRALAIEASF